MDRWSEGNSYESYMGRWSRLVAREFVDWLGVRPGSSWLDVGCGTGALSGRIGDVSRPSGVTGIDQSAEFIETARAALGGLADLRVADAGALPFDADEFDAAVSGLVLNFLPDPEVAVSEMRRVTRPDGMVAVYVWDYTDGMQMIRRFWDAAVELDPGVAALDEAARFPVCRPERLAAIFERCDLGAVDIAALEVPTVFQGFDEYWRPFLGGQGPAPSYVSSLDDVARSRLESRLRQYLPTTDDGVIELMARAWAVKGAV
jgi:SAM-dependent methyltransferase